MADLEWTEWASVLLKTTLRAPGVPGTDPGATAHEMDHCSSRWESKRSIPHSDPRSVFCAQWFANELQLRKHRPVGRTETYRTASSPSPSLCCVCVSLAPSSSVYAGFILPYGLFISLPSLHFFRCLLVTGGSGVSHERGRTRETVLLSHCVHALAVCSTICMFTCRA